MSGKGVKKMLAAQEAEVSRLSTALEQTYSDYTLLQRTVEDLQYIDISGGSLMGSNVAVITDEQRVRVITRIRRLRHENPIAKQAIRLTKRFVLGKGISYVVDDDQLKTIVDDFWTDPVNRTVLTSPEAMNQRFDETLTDGELFFVLFPSSESPYVRLGTIPMEEVTQIIYDPDNDNIPVWYKRVYRERKYDAELNAGQGGWTMTSEPVVKYHRDFRIDDDRLKDIEDRGLVIPEARQGVGRVKHRLINQVRMRSGFRGLSELYSSREWLRVFKEFMEDRGAINAAANAFAYQRKIKGGASAVNRVSGRLGGVKVLPDADGQAGLSEFQMTRPSAGSMYDTNEGISLTPIKSDTGAPQAERDARLLLMAGGAGVATPIHYFGDGHQALAGAQAVELPMVKGYEDWQQFHRAEFSEIIEFVIDQAMPDSADVDVSERKIVWLFSQIMTPDVVKWITANAQLTQQIAPKNRAVKRLATIGGLTALNVPNIEMEMKAIDEEEDRLFKEQQDALKTTQDAAKAAADRAASAPPSPFGGNGFGGNGHIPGVPPVPDAHGKNATDGQRAGTIGAIPAISPKEMRMVAGRPPAEPTTGPRSKRQ